MKHTKFLTVKINYSDKKSAEQYINSIKTFIQGQSLFYARRGISVDYITVEQGISKGEEE